MGLDMYFYLKKYESQCPWRGKGKVLVYDEDLKDLEKDIFDRNFKSIETQYQVGYFRKFNALHKYIVDKFANGVDKCQEIHLVQYEIENILEELKSVNKENAKEKLPTSDGFFFGSQEYDEWYFKDIEYAIDMFTKVLKVLEKDEEGKWDFYYQASW